MSKVDEKSTEEILDLLNGDTIWNAARKILTHSFARLEQDAQQRVPISPIEYRREEFRIVEKIAKLFGVTELERDAPEYRFSYRNWRGEIAERRVRPIRMEFGATEWHPEPQWLMIAWDLDKNAERAFAMADINPL